MSYNSDGSVNDTHTKQFMCIQRVSFDETFLKMHQSKRAERGAILHVLITLWVE
jgi:hypothetical protein